MSRWYPPFVLAIAFAAIHAAITSRLPDWRAGLLFVVLAAASQLAVGAMRSIAVRWMLDHPNERSSHSSPTPRGGGIAIVALALGSLLVAALTGGPARPGIIIAAAAAVVATIGLGDDLRPLSSRIRLVIHLAAAVVVVALLGPIAGVELSLGVTLPFSIFAFPLTVVWIAGLTNAYNFMDGIDGIAAIQAMVAALAWAIVGSFSSDALLGLAGIAIAGASAGFLWHNWSPARIFMGDVGSGFLGFTFGCLTLLAWHREPRAVVAGALFVWPFVFDAVFTFSRRLARGENVFEAHRSHLYQRLVVAGASHRAVTTLYGGLASACSVAGLLFYVKSDFATVIGVATAFGASAVLVSAVRVAEHRLRA